MELPRPESPWKRAALVAGAVVGFLAFSLVGLPVALLAVEFVVGIAATVVSVLTEPRRGRRPA
ncbi:hypothetical protein [Haladaptatus salinisoli]|uniref:hypothetical protein n=1 Tax=Haladaptatus salinisoli TaxID=2884876 RepID=UPI001D0A1530|nr:hypothetical protein [Haladaptatus salinisoli]